MEKTLRKAFSFCLALVISFTTVVTDVHATELQQSAETTEVTENTTDTNIQTENGENIINEEPGIDSTVPAENQTQTTEGNQLPAANENSQTSAGEVTEQPTDSQAVEEEAADGETADGEVSEEELLVEEPEEEELLEDSERIKLDENGVLQMYNGLVQIGADKYYYLDGVKTYAGLILIDGAYYYITSSCKAVMSRSYYVSKTNDLKPAATYAFDADGKMIIDGDDNPGGETQTFTGIKADSDGILRYYIKDEIQNNNGLILLDAKYYYVNGSGVVISSRDYGITKTNNLTFSKADGTTVAFQSGKNYTFDESGVLQLYDGLVDIGNDKYYYVDGIKTYAGLVHLDGAYYYITSSCKAVVGRSYYVSKTNDLKPAATYTFDETGKMVD